MPSARPPGTSASSRRSASLAAWHTQALQHGLLDRYLLGLLVAIVAAALLALSFAAGRWLWPAAHGISAQLLATGAITVAGALAALWVRDRFVLLLASGLVGYGCAGLFLFAGAPDLAFTQFAVETVFRRRRGGGVAGNPRRSDAGPCAAGTAACRTAEASGLDRFRRGMLTLYLLLAAGQPFDAALGEFFGARSVAAANGRNVVNVIIVDFRALDTLGEIAVLAFALLAAAPLFKLARERSGKTP